uniref:Cysteine-rich receptor-like protein kinase 8 n=1 Tax=Noccaea caerulescens TaxID=107243 RepID=A0A1J3K3D8_NOCCA
MSCYASLIFLFLFSFLTSFRASAQDPTYIYHNCPNTTTYARNSTYFANLRTLLSSLSSRNASSYSTRFRNATAGRAPDRVTGVFLCRGDLSPEACRNCVTFSVNDTLTRCPNEREAVIYYQECMLRYSDQSILSTLSYDAPYILSNPNNISSNQEDRFADLVSSAMSQAALEAANSSRRFSAIKTNWTALQTLYGLVQCSPDIRKQECLSCLHQSIDALPLYRLGGRILWPSCNSRYELYRFYNETAIRTAPPPPPTTASTSPVSSPPRPEKGGKSYMLVLVILVAVMVAVLFFIAAYCFFAKKKKKKTSDTAPTFEGDDITTVESLQLEYKTIQAATNDFSQSNKIGQGGFGEVYKGTFSDGTEVAVKKLSKSSGQGDTEFKNEVVVVAKLQHRNLVRLLGFSIEGEERVLVYEYVPNKSLDYFLSDPTKQGELNWTRRYQIIGGIARGILYLHQDSRLTIIHRDLKASNILLDADMNPKIADFGMARIFGIDQTQENTSKIVGTYGYMSPEYAMHGQFSMKSDVYSFGVLVLEIISGQKNSSFYQTDSPNDLVTHAWRLWSNGTSLDLVDPVIVENCQKSEVVRCIHIGLLCVQENPVERPTMRTIFMMLTSDTVTLPVAREPGFFLQSSPEKDPLDTDQSTTTKSVATSVDDSSITDLYPR